MEKQTFFKNDYNRIFTVRGLWNIGQPFVCGELKEVVEYALTLKNGIDFFAEINSYKIKKVSKKDLEKMLDAQGLSELKDKLFKVF